ncbi:ABC transporter permease [Acidovorax sp. Leaf76]|uniref:MlaE family ABC transporter permease n=1 Tax=unclassified Acidovorax TaxID=2684926 RepID=UPI00070212FE|nr:MULTISPECIES: ABC transporter permease [unclassified Acidovorax]KQO26357.1 ABC transporter permease [Acidovorax sp. Leaf76]KQO40119.1 ABC transporter permease [Acidovorax sp. Leaf84]KQS42268.1 ABC transporter permease [Acidovorax sp. Leaf191]
MTDPAPRIVRADTPQGACAQLHGRWGAAELGTRRQWAAVSGQLQSNPAAPDLGWDLTPLQWLDHVGAQLVWNHWQRAWPERLDCTDAQRDMLERVAELTTGTEPPREPWRLAEEVDRLGVLVLHGVNHARHMLEMVGQLVLDMGRLARNPRRGPWRDVSGHLYRMGATALPITALVGFLIGVVLAYLMSLQLRQFGAESFIVNILGISLIRELGPMLAAILVAGRSGSAITAQIGVMRVTEELDAMRVMGIPHGFRLVMPRTIALAIAMPLISLWTTLAALAGGMLAADLAMDISPAYFVQALPAAVKVGNLGLAMAKSVVFGAFIALIGCHWGLRVKPNTQSLGEGTTASVVTSITMVIIVDALFAIGFKNIGI